MPLFGAAFAAPKKGITILSDLDLLIPAENRTIQGLFKAFVQFSSTFQGIFYCQGLFKKGL